MRLNVSPPVLRSMHRHGVRVTYACLIVLRGQREKLAKQGLPIPKGHPDDVRFGRDLFLTKMLVEACEGHRN